VSAFYFDLRLMNYPLPRTLDTLSLVSYYYFFLCVYCPVTKSNKLAFDQLNVWLGTTKLTGL